MKDYLPLLPTTEYDYELPVDRIALHPAHPRDQAQLLIYRNGKISDRVFSHLPEELPENTLLVCNDTKVIPARLHFRNEVGARIEIFLVKPLSDDKVVWEVLAGGRRKFKEGTRLLAVDENNEALDPPLWVEWENRQQNTVRFKCREGINLWQTLLHSGSIPLPPYLHRKVAKSDEEDYQTVFAKNEGAVAAPTASLHFTETLLDDLKSKGVKLAFATLHVGLGTFKPVEAGTTVEHNMHAEDFSVSEAFLDTLIAHKGPVIPVGTTAMRLLESLHFMGAALLAGREAPNVVLRDAGFDPQLAECNTEQALHAVKQYCQLHHGELTGSTSIFIIPGYQFRLSDALITNFHQPGSTLLMLVAAFVGKNWRNIYRHALAGNYRFLSYGDGSLLFPGV